MLDTHPESEARPIESHANGLHAFRTPLRIATPRASAANYRFSAPNMTQQTRVGYNSDGRSLIKEGNISDHHECWFIVQPFRAHYCVRLFDYESARLHLFLLEPGSSRTSLSFMALNWSRTGAL